MRLIDADALIDELMERYCKECYKRRGIKNGKYQIIYEIGETPCRACAVGDATDDIENAPTVEVVRCKDCKYYNHQHHYCEGIGYWFGYEDEWSDNGFCYKGERREDEDDAEGTEEDKT